MSVITPPSKARCPVAHTGLTKLGPPGSVSAMCDMVVKTIPLGRMGRKWDIGMACVFLSSPAARCVACCGLPWSVHVLAGTLDCMTRR